MVNQINARYEVENPVFSWMDDIMTEAPESWAKTTEIMAELREKGARLPDGALSTEIAAWMKQNGYESKRIWIKAPDGNRQQARVWQGVELRTRGLGG